jgi:hypothetical protein
MLAKVGVNVDVVHGHVGRGRGRVSLHLRIRIASQYCRSPVHVPANLNLISNIIYFPMFVLKVIIDP